MKLEIRNGEVWLITQSHVPHGAGYEDREINLSQHILELFEVASKSRGVTVAETAAETERKLSDVLELFKVREAAEAAAVATEAERKLGKAAQSPKHAKTHATGARTHGPT